jgi:hypothetical protein
VPYQLRSNAYSSNSPELADRQFLIFMHNDYDNAFVPGTEDGPLSAAKRVGESLTNHCLGTDEQAAEKKAFGGACFGVSPL